MKDGWPKKTLGEVCEFRGGGTPSKAVDSFWHGDIPWVSPKDMKSEIVSDSIDHISTEAIRNSATSLIPKDAVLIVVRSGILARTVPIAITGREVTINQDLKALCPRSTIHPRYLYRLLDARMDVLLGLVSRGATVHRLITEQIRALEFFLPPVSEQRRIVGVIDEMLDDIAIAKSNAEKNSLNARALFDSYRESVFSQRQQGWIETTLDKLSTNLDSKRVPITKNVRKKGEYPYYGASGIVDYVADYIFDGDTLLVSEDGANLLARSTPIAFSATGKYWVNNHAHILKFENMATQRFVESYLESIKIDDYITGTAQPKLNQAALNSIPIPIPTSVDEQDKIVRRIETLSNETERLEVIYQQKLTALDSLKKALLYQAFNGML